MANEQNLVSLATRSQQERTEIARKGQIASTKAKKEKATMKATLEMLLNEKSSKTGQTYKELATLGLLKGAIKGNSQNYRVILETLGELTQLQEDRQAQQLNRVEELLTKIDAEAKK